MTGFRRNIAVTCGVNAAIIADHLWEELALQAMQKEAIERHGRYWCRCSYQMMTVDHPYLSIHMVRDAVEALQKNNIIRKGCFNENRFDHTNWYTFTEYGEQMMNEGAAA